MSQEKFTFFWGYPSPFSNWYQPCTFTLDNCTYNCSEQFLMAEKARMFNDAEALDAIMKAAHPREQKQLGRLVKNFVKDPWNKIAKRIMYRGCFAKFQQNPSLLKALLDTVGTTLVEASPTDKIWGIGLKEDDPRAQSRDTWLGTNWLGETLTSVRNDLQGHTNDRQII